MLHLRAAPLLPRITPFAGAGVEMFCVELVEA
jgi:hypothetical protein